MMMKAAAIRGKALHQAMRPANAAVAAALVARAMAEPLGPRRQTQAPDSS